MTAVQAATGKTPVLYTSPDYFARNRIAPGRLVGYPLWVAHPDVDCPSVPRPWTRSRFWQYASDGTVEGIPGTTDINAFFGTPDDLAAYAASGGHS
jgi:lysozyme